MGAPETRRVLVGDSLVVGIKIDAQQVIVATIVAEFIATESGLGFRTVSAGKQLRDAMPFDVLVIGTVVEWTRQVLLDGWRKVSKPT